MRFSGPFAVLAAALLFACPPPAVAQFDELWESIPPMYRFIGEVGDLDNDGVSDFLTGEEPSHGGWRIGVRSAATGELQALSNDLYNFTDLFTVDLDGDGPKEIVLKDDMNRLVCLDYFRPGNPLVIRWELDPFSGIDPELYFFADLDGNRRMYVVFQSRDSHGDEFKVYDHRGGSFGEYVAARAAGMMLDNLGIADYDNDNRDEILLVYRDAVSEEHHVIMLESTVPVGVETQPGELRSVELGRSVPNPMRAEARIEYTVPTRGPVSLRVFDVAGREIRTLLDGPVAAGRHEAIWDGRDANGRALPAGAYFYELNVGGLRLGRRVIRLQ